MAKMTTAQARKTSVKLSQSLLKTNPNAAVLIGISAALLAALGDVEKLEKTGTVTVASIKAYLKDGARKAFHSGARAAGHAV